MRQENKEQSEQLGISKTKPRLPGQSVPRSQLPMELLTPRELSQTTEVQVSTGSIRETIPDPSDTLGDPVVEKTTKQLMEATGRIETNRSVPGSGVTAPYGTIDDTAEWSSNCKKRLLLLRRRSQEESPLG